MGKGAKCCFFCSKRAFANFVPIWWNDHKVIQLGSLMVQTWYSLLMKLIFFFKGNFQRSEDDSITMFVPTYKEHLVSSSIMRNDNIVLKKYSTPCACTNKRLSCSIALHKRQQNIVQHMVIEHLQFNYLLSVCDIKWGIL